VIGSFRPIRLVDEKEELKKRGKIAGGNKV
jgi:hypothetical protein